MPPDCRPLVADEPLRLAPPEGARNRAVNTSAPAVVQSAKIADLFAGVRLYRLLGLCGSTSAARSSEG